MRDALILRNPPIVPLSLHDRRLYMIVFRHAVCRPSGHNSEGTILGRRHFLHFPSLFFIAVTGTQPVLAIVTLL